jgi:hypothetical protein
MQKSDSKYVIGNRPPRALSTEAKAQLERGHRSKSMEDLVKKGSNATVAILQDKASFSNLPASGARKKKRE